MARKVAVLGGGMAGLTAAYELTRTPELRSQHEVTVYQMGWRVGGKAASGRDEHGRNLEHGLHVWFGCYENVFRMVKEIYREWQKPAGCPLQDWTDVAKPQVYTPIGVQDGDSWVYYPLEWPIHGGQPGDGNEIPWSPWAVLGMLSDMFIEIVRDAAREYAKLDADDATPTLKIAPEARKLLALPLSFAGVVAENSGLTLQERVRAMSLIDSARTAIGSFEHYAEAAQLWTKHIVTQRRAVDRTTVDEIFALYSMAYREFTSLTAPITRDTRALGATRGRMDVRFRVIREFMNIFSALARGYLLDILLPDRPFESLDDVDLRAWLISHGAEEDVVSRSSVLRIVYDTLFQFRDGDVRYPSYAAGTALGCIARLTVTYKGAMMWDIQAGMGEAVIAPLYEVLKARGVTFRFFHKVTKLDLAAGNPSSIGRITIKRQAKVKGNRDYEPLILSRNLKCWTHEPDWKQLEPDPRWDPNDPPDFENHWLDGPQVGEPIELLAGRDFDSVVLAISMGAYKNLNNEDVSMCQALIDRGGKFRRFVENIGIVPTQSLQLWSDKSLEDLGWKSGKPATVSGPEYLNIWADMTQVLAVEDWRDGSPKSLHYLCGTLATDVYRQPASKRDAWNRITRDLRSEQIAWLNANAHVMWPQAGERGRFDFKVLHGAGEDLPTRFDTQFSRANVSPTECCVLSAAGTTQYRLHAGDSEFENLVLAGEATRHGFNTTAIEGAVMSGMAASFHICGSPERIPGYDFLQRRPSDPERPLAPSTDRGVTGQRLVPYISLEGRAATALSPPARFKGVKAYFFSIATRDETTRGSSAAAPAPALTKTFMQNVVDDILNKAGGGRVTYQVSLPYALVSFLDMAECTSLVHRYGYLPGRECAVWIPLFERNGTRVRPVLWSPYIFINYDIGLATGREVWGWPKQLADIGMPASRNGSLEFTCSTDIFETFSPDKPGRRRPLITITQGTGSSPRAAVSGRSAVALQCFTEALKRVAGPLIGGFGLPMLSAVAVKQFRDAAQPDLACYRALVDSPVRMTGFRGAGLLDGEYWLNLTTCQSHQIGKDLFGDPRSGGLRCKVETAAWAEFDFEALPGTVIV
jgi:uncharacterized protein with NAD-binding domain and iron-sulfur cluster